LAFSVQGKSVTFFTTQLAYRHFKHLQFFFSFCGSYPSQQANYRSAIMSYDSARKGSAPPPKAKLVIAIDYGTTFSGVAFAHTESVSESRFDG
jgi:hypothetical protein